MRMLHSLLSAVPMRFIVTITASACFPVLGRWSYKGEEEVLCVKMKNLCKHMSGCSGFMNKVHGYRASWFLWNLKHFSWTNERSRVSPLRFQVWDWESEWGQDLFLHHIVIRREKQRRTKFWEIIKILVSAERAFKNDLSDLFYGWKIKAQRKGEKKWPRSHREILAFKPGCVCLQDPLSSPYWFPARHGRTPGPLPPTAITEHLAWTAPVAAGGISYPSCLDARVGGKCRSDSFYL